jgi:hypothetical protein
MNTKLVDSLVQIINSLTEEEKKNLEEKLHLQIEPEKINSSFSENEPFIGMWQDREDMEDSNQWVRHLREQGSKSGGGDMVQQILVDTDILIDVGRGVQIAVNRLQSETKTSSPAIGVITKMELMVGCRNKTELQKLGKFLQHYGIIKVNASISDQAVELLSDYRLSHGLLIPDAFIAATAIVFAIPLLTKNQSDYRFIPNLNLPSYPYSLVEKIITPNSELLTPNSGRIEMI